MGPGPRAHGLTPDGTGQDDQRPPCLSHQHLPFYPLLKLPAKLGILLAEFFIVELF